MMFQDFFFEGFFMYLKSYPNQQSTKKEMKIILDVRPPSHEDENVRQELKFLLSNALWEHMRNTDRAEVS